MMDDLDLEQLKKELGDTPDGGGRFTVDDILREAELEQGAAEQTYSLIEQQDELTGAEEEKSDPLAEQEDVFAKMAESIESSRPSAEPTAEKSLADERMDAFARMIAAMETEDDAPEREEPAPEPPVKTERRKPKVRAVSLEHGVNDLEPDEPERGEEPAQPSSQSESGWEELESETHEEPDDEEREQPRGLLSRLFGETEEREETPDEPEEQAAEQTVETPEEEPRGGFWSRLFGGAQEEPEQDSSAGFSEETDEEPETEDEELVTVPEAEKPEDETAPREGFFSRLFRMNDAMANDFSDLDDDEPEDEEDGDDEKLDAEEYDEDEYDEGEDEETAPVRGGFFSRLFGRTERDESEPYDDESELPEEEEPEDDTVTAAFAEPDESAEETRVMPELPENEPKPLTEQELLTQTRVIETPEPREEPAEQPEQQQEQPETPAQEPIDAAGSDFWSRLFGTDSLRAEQSAATETDEETRVMPELGAEEQRPLTYEELLAQTRVVPTASEPEAEPLPEKEPAQPAISEEELREFLTDARSSEEAGTSFEQLLRDSGAPETPEQPKKIEFDAFPDRETTVYFDITLPKQTETAGEEPHRAELFDAEEALEEAEEQRARQEEKRRLIEDSTDDSWVGLSLDELSKLAPPLEELRREGPVMVREVERQKEYALERRREYLEKQEAARRRAEDEARKSEPEETPEPPQETSAPDGEGAAQTEESEKDPVFR